jgi:hypothetical protein
LKHEFAFHLKGEAELTGEPSIDGVVEGDELVVTWNGAPVVKI